MAFMRYRRREEGEATEHFVLEVIFLPLYMVPEEHSDCEGFPAAVLAAGSCKSCFEGKRADVNP